MILLNPGPVTLTARVRAALLEPDLCHRSEEFSVLLDTLCRGIESVHARAHDETAPMRAVLLSGSGTLAVESMLDSFVAADERIVVVANGVYGERIASMLQARAIRHTVVRSAWTEDIDWESLDVALRAGGVRYVVAVHHETTTGRLNDLARLLALCESLGAGVLLDAVSSFGAESISVSHPALCAIAGTANKCLHGVPGVAFVLARPVLLAPDGSHARSVYLDLSRYDQARHDHAVPFTPAMQSCFALRAALVELHDDGGWHRRRARYLTLSTRLRDALRDCKLSTVVPETACASMLTAWYLPPRVSYDDLDATMTSAGFTIYPGQGAFRGRVLRLATMGHISDHDMDRLIPLLVSTLDA